MASRGKDNRGPGARFTPPNAPVAGTKHVGGRQIKSATAVTATMSTAAMTATTSGNNGSSGSDGVSGPAATSTAATATAAVSSAMSGATAAAAPTTNIATAISTSTTAVAPTLPKPTVAGPLTGPGKTLTATLDAAAPAVGSSGSPSPSESSENVPPVAQTTSMPRSSESTDATRCVICLTSVPADELMACRYCESIFHARCGNLPQTPEEGEFFCRWACYTAFRKGQDDPPKTPLEDFSRLAGRVQSILSELPRRGTRGSTNAAQLASAAGLEEPLEGRGGRGRSASERERGMPPTNGRSRSTSPFQPIVDLSSAQLPTNGYIERRKELRSRKAQAVAMEPHARSQQLRSFSSPEERSVDPKSSSQPPGATFDYEDLREGARVKRPKYIQDDDASIRRAQRLGGYAPPSSLRPSPYEADGTLGVEGSHRQGYQPHPTFFDSGELPASDHPSGPPRVHAAPPPYDGERNGNRSRPSSATRYDQAAMDPTPYRDVASAQDGYTSRPGGNGPLARVHVDAFSGFTGHEASNRMGDSIPGSGASRPTMPWLNAVSFPEGLYERFDCHRDNLSGIFRIDLTPVFLDKTIQLYQSEIDFFFRCFESPTVSLVVKGMASDLNQYIWAWPFILESCGSETHFTFDHFQFRHKSGTLPELEYVGQLHLSMSAYNAYLERYLSGNMAKEVLVLEDLVTKKPVTLVAAENVIVLNDLAIAEHCTQLFTDLIKSFQWDVFAGGIHCLLQYVPQNSRAKRFSSPLLHFNFPGARGRLRDPGNGTTDQAYQMLVGSLELVIFERLEPNDREEFHRVLRRAGYDAELKSMLLDSHLRMLREAGFTWSTVLLTDGDFVHVNKGRIHFWRVVEPEERGHGPMPAPCVFLSWQWVYQGVSQRGISTECWFAMKNASLCAGGWAFDPRRAIVEAAKCGVSVVRTGQFLNSLSAPTAPPVLRRLAFTGTPAGIDRSIIGQRQEQMVLFLESILPCMDAIVEEEFELGLVKDDSEDFRKIFDDELMWKVVDTALSDHDAGDPREYHCGICQLELTNIYKQCLGCTVHSRRSRPNMAYRVFRICLRCHAQPEHHHFKPRGLHGYYEKLCSSEGHTGLLPATRRYQSERSYFKCRCTPYIRCMYCGGCESCCCLCHTLFQTRFRYTSPEHLDHLRTDVVDVIKWHKQHR